MAQPHRLRRTTASLAVALVALLCAAAGASDAAAAPSLRKAIWGPIERDGVSQFPIYDQLGVGIYQTSIRWADVAPTRPANPGDPSDPAYRWSPEIDRAVSEARQRGIRVLVAVGGTPRWANGGRGIAWAPKRAADYGRFLAAASRRYPGVRYWLIWGEPTKRTNFKPLAAVVAGRKIKPKHRRGPRRYAEMLDSAYAALKRVRRTNVVIGGNSFTSGTVPPLTFVNKLLRLPGGKPPRMDLYGHNPFSARRPVLSKPPLGYGYADFGDLDTLSRAVDRNLARPRGKRHLQLFLSEYTLPTDHSNWEFNFYVDRKTQARWLADALRVTRRSKRIYSLGWLSLYDDPPRPGGDEVNRGLMEYDGQRKPAFRAYARG
jgi:hypothetical protein